MTPPAAEQKAHDLFYAGEDWCRPLRKAAREQLSDGQNHRLTINIPKERMPFTDFAQAIHSSWLCVSPAGLGWDCYRHYEAGLFGAVPVLSRADILPYRPYLHGLDAIYYDPERSILEQLKPWLADKSRLIEMARRARAHVLQNHTRKARSDYILEAIHSRSPNPAE
jgi:hypothetical protein